MNIITIIAILLFFYFAMSYKESFESTMYKTNDKNCSQNAINDAYTNYIFGGVKVSPVLQ